MNRRCFLIFSGLLSLFGIGKGFAQSSKSLGLSIGDRVLVTNDEEFRNHYPLIDCCPYVGVEGYILKITKEKSIDDASDFYDVAHLYSNRTMVYGGNPYIKVPLLQLKKLSNPT